MALTVTNTSQWTWVGRSRRHTVRFEHNTLSGAQRLVLDGADYFNSGWKFRLTGSIYLPVDGSTVELYITANEYGALSYALCVDAQRVPAAGEEAVSPGATSPKAAVAQPGQPLPTPPGVSSWTVSCGGKRHAIEYHHKTLDILVDGVKVQAAGSFAEDEDEEAAAAAAGGADSFGSTVSGVKYEFVIPPSMSEAVLTVVPARDGRSPPACALRVEGAPT